MVKDVLVIERLSKEDEDDDDERRNGHWQNISTLRWLGKRNVYFCEHEQQQQKEAARVLA